MLLFAAPMILGNLLQQVYNIADTLIVGRFLGADPLAAVGSSYTLMTFLTSILIGLCMGSGAVFSICFGRKDRKQLKRSMTASFCMIALVTIVINVLSFVLIDEILWLLRVPEEIYDMMRGYVQVIFVGITFVFLYNYFAFLLRAVGNSMVPLWFLAVSAVVNIVLDLIFVILLRWGVEGAAAATVIAQGISGVGIAVYTFWKEPQLRLKREDLVIQMDAVKEIAEFSFSTCIQQSVMNFGILMVQGLVNSFGTVVMTAFAAAVKIDSFAYMPAQEFGNAFSIFIAQNYGAGEKERIRGGIRSAVKVSMAFCIVISIVVFVFAGQLMQIFVDPANTDIIAVGISYLRIEGAFYCGIGCLFLLYGYFRAVGRPMMSVVLTVISLGMRVALAYLLSAVPSIGVLGIWWAIPIGWILADIAGIRKIRK